MAKDPEAQRIINLFPSTNVKLVEHQKVISPVDLSLAKAILSGKRILMIGQTSSFVKHFDGKIDSFCSNNNSKNIDCSKTYCQPYYKLVPASNGCPYHCTYCYLAFVYRKYAPYIKIKINYDKLFKQIRKVSSETFGKTSFNMGEMLDSLALDHITNLTTMLVPFFSGFSKIHLMLLTKSSNIDNLLSLEPNNQTVISWSLNSEYSTKTFELGTASLDERINAAKLCQNRGWRVRFRIDPGILHENWKSGYADLIEKALTAIEPENITLGMLRLFPGHFKLAKEAYGPRGDKLNNCYFVKGASDGKLRYLPEKRIEFYSFLIDTIRCFNKNISIGLCREMPEVWDTLKNRCEIKKCNCLVW